MDTKLHPQHIRLGITPDRPALHTYTMQYLMSCIEKLGGLAVTDDWPYDSNDELAMQLEVWRNDFQKNNPGTIASEPVLVICYGDSIILVCNQETGEYLTLTHFPHAL